MDELSFIAALRSLATHPAARGFTDDAAVLGDLVLTHDMIVEGVHFRTSDAPADVAWKLLAVNLSDLAAKGAEPIGVLMGYMLAGDDEWDRAFLAGFAEALTTFAVSLLGGDTVPAKGAPRSFGLTAIGRSPIAPPRSGARAGDALYVTGTIGLAGLGLVGEGGREAARAYLRPMPRLDEGHALAPLSEAMMDVSDGLLIDASRMADASGLALTIDLPSVPVAGDRMAAITAGDDYELLFAAPPDTALPVAASRIGIFTEGSGMTLKDGNSTVPLPEKLGWLHQ